jgi:hypothetical protein
VLAPGVAATVSLHRNGLDRSVSVTAADDGAFEARLVTTDGSPIGIIEGDEIRVTWPGGTVDVTVPLLTAVIDAATRTISGKGPPSTTVTIALSGFGGGGGGGTAQITTQTDADGNYSQVVGAGGGGGGAGPLPAGTRAEAAIDTAAGHEVFVLAIVPYVEVTLGAPHVAGLASPLIDVGVSLLESGQPIASGITGTDTDGAFGLDLSTLPRAGLQIVITPLGEDPTTVDLPDLRIQLDAPGASITGAAPADGFVRVRLYNAAGTVFTVFRRVDANGAFDLANADLPGNAPFRIEAAVRVEALLNVQNGHLVIAFAGQALPTPSPTPTGPVPTETPSTPPPTLTPAPPTDDGRFSIYTPSVLTS